MVIMDTKIQLENALKDAMRSGDDLRKRTIRMALSAIRMAEVDKGGALDETAVLSIVQKEIKSRQEAIEDARRANRPDLIESSQAEITVLQDFLPKQLTEEELEALAKQVIAAVGATNLREMGQVMKALVPRLEGRAPGDQASQVVRRLLQ
jgi:uncharacterized protein YqeY